LLQQIPSRLPKRLEFEREKAKDLIRTGLQNENHLLTELEAKSLLASYGIPMNRMKKALSNVDAVQRAQDIGFPVVMKISSRNITHKSETGGVYLNLRNEIEVSEAYEKIVKNAKACNPKARIDGVTIQPMLNRPAYEIILGAKKDRDFGAVILFGMGGVFAEVLQDRAIALPPLNRLLAKRLMGETKVYHLLQGYRNIPPVNIPLLEEILIRLAHLVTDFSGIEELDINPLFVTKNDACTIDASNLHLQTNKRRII
jgi:acetyltransferase